MIEMVVAISIVPKKMYCNDGPDPINIEPKTDNVWIDPAMIFDILFCLLGNILDNNTITIAVSIIIAIISRNKGEKLMPLIEPAINPLMIPGSYNDRISA